MKPFRFVSVDVETASVRDLRKVGSAAYGEHPSTVITTLSWKVDDEPTRSWLWSDPVPADLIRLAKDPQCNFLAWNASFERNVWPALMRQFPGLSEVPLERWFCSMIHGAVFGLPLRLDDAGDAIGAPVVKDRSVADLVKRMARPRKKKPLEWWHETDRPKLERLARYCARDVESERAIYLRLPKLPPSVREGWLIDQRINGRGVAIDAAFVDVLEKRVVDEIADLNERLARLTGGTVDKVTNAARFLASLQAIGYPEEDLTRASVEARLRVATGLEADLLAIRLEASRASTAKLTKMKAWRSNDGRARFNLQYYGAHTGRSAGRGIQLQNLPRPLTKMPDHLVASAAAGRWNPRFLADIHGTDPMGAVASCLRGCIVAEPGNQLISGDFSQIEARLTSWAGGEQAALDVFARGEDIYTHAAKQIGSPDRQLGKIVTLALGFGMGPVKFAETALGYGIELTEERAREITYAWREANPGIKRLWDELSTAAIYLGDWTKGDAQKIKVRKFTLSRRGNAMTLELPSGRELVYRNCRVVFDRDKENWQFVYDGYQKGRWGPVRTWGGSLTENAIQAMAADLLFEVLVAADTAGLSVVLSVHDEVVLEEPADRAKAAYDTLIGLMRRVPPWATGLPIAAAGWIGPRYRKG